jgi:hypothetical protein
MILAAYVDGHRVIDPYPFLDSLLHKISAARNTSVISEPQERKRISLRTTGF